MVILALVLRKIKIGYDAMQYVRGCAHEVSFEGIVRFYKIMQSGMGWSRLGLNLVLGLGLSLDLVLVLGLV